MNLTISEKNLKIRPVLSERSVWGGVVIDGPALFYLLMLFALTRFFIGSASLAVLAVFFAASLYASAKTRAYWSDFVFYPCALVTAFASIYDYATQNLGQCSYFFYISLYLILIQSFVKMRISYRKPEFRLFCVFFIVANFAFLIFPELAGYASAKAIAIIRSDIEYANPADLARFHSFFMHANEVGIFTAAITWVAIKFVDGNDGWLNYLVDVSVCLSLLAIIWMSGSETGAVIVSFAVLRRILSAKTVFILALLVVLGEWFTQLILAGAIENILKSGSFWWRYLMADEITSHMAIIQFDPVTIGRLSNWPHSIALDSIVTFGLFGFAILGISFLLLALLVPYDTGTGVLLLLAAAGVQPAGAMPTSFLALLLTLSIATRKSTALSGRVNRNTREVSPAVDEIRSFRRYPILPNGEGC